MPIAINRGKCVGCGRCARVCALGVLTMADGVPAISREERCIHCHHCYAACPAGAIALDGLDARAARTPGAAASPEGVMALLERRYSCREYSPDAVSAEDLALLRRALETAPTGCNARATRYVVFDTPERTQSFREEFRRRIESSGAAADSPTIRTLRVMLRLQPDPILRGAPHAIVACHRADAPTGLVDCVIGLSHFEFVAQALGLGTCWCGFVPLAAKDAWPTLAQDIGLPEGFVLGYAMLFGHKAFDYARPVSPNPLGQ